MAATVRWPWSRDRRGIERAEETLTAADEALAATEAIQPRVDALHDEHERRLRQDDFGRQIAAAFHLRRVR